MKSLTLNCFIALIPAVVFAFVAFAAMHISNNLGESFQCGPQRLQDIGEPCEYEGLYPLIIRSTVPIIIGSAMFTVMLYQLIKRSKINL